MNTQFERCKVKVDKPTFVQKNDGTDIKVWFQWFGESKICDLSNKQFLFPVNVSLDQFYFHPEKFDIVMVGPVQKWYESARQSMIKKFGENTNIIYFLSSEIGVEQQGKIVPAGGVVRLSIILAEEESGIIEPRYFLDDSVRTEAIKKLNA